MIDAVLVLCLAATSIFMAFTLKVRPHWLHSTASFFAAFVWFGCFCFPGVSLVLSFGLSEFPPGIFLWWLLPVLGLYICFCSHLVSFVVLIADSCFCICLLVLLVTNWDPRLLCFLVVDFLFSCATVMRVFENPHGDCYTLLIDVRFNRWYAVLTEGSFCGDSDDVEEPNLLFCFLISVDVPHIGIGLVWYFGRRWREFLLWIPSIWVF